MNALEPRRSGEPSRRADDDPDSDELLELLGDQYARQVLQAVADEPRAGQEIAEATGISTPTVYRRLDELEEAGFVESEMVFDADGHHYQVYRSVLEGADLRFGREGLTVSVRTDDGDRSIAADP